jgi:hypothetical protein
MGERPKIPTDRPSSWTVDENGEWTEQPFLVVDPGPGRSYDCFDTSELGPIPFKDGQMLGGSWSGQAEDHAAPDNDE